MRVTAVRIFIDGMLAVAGALCLSVAAVTLNRLRNAFNRLRNALGISFSEPRHDYRTLKTVLTAAQELASSWGGKMFFVFLPSSNSYAGFGRFDRTVLIVRDRLRDLTEKMGIPFIDGQSVFDAASHDEALFYGLGSHYTPKGQRLIGSAVRESLSQAR